ncbi:hypothetical protein ACQ3I4_13070 [Zafaria sp. Z1313]|uniref:hypothetical protein n=1 Tax=Zafaria sp. Z1313 TaxID=3423202 RepID=UPI003D301D92
MADDSPCTYYEMERWLDCGGVTDLGAIPVEAEATEVSITIPEGVAGTGYDRLADFDAVESIQLIRVDNRALDAIAGMESLRRAEVHLAEGVVLDQAALGRLDQLASLSLTTQTPVDFSQVTGLDSLESLYLRAAGRPTVVVPAGATATWPAIRDLGGRAITPTFTWVDGYHPSTHPRLVDEATLTATSVKTGRWGAVLLSFARTGTGPLPGLPRLRTHGLYDTVGVHVTGVHRHHPLSIDKYRPASERPALVGDTLAVPYDPPASPFDVQWFRDGQPIPGATGPEYQLVAADGARRISVRYTFVALDRWRPLVPASTVTATYGDIIRTTPVKATLGGTHRAGRVVTASVPADVFPQAQRSYQWFAGDEPIKGATKPSFTLRQRDVNQPIHARVTLSGPGIAPMTVASAKKVVLPGQITGTVPKISGKMVVGHKLTAIAGTSTPKATSIGYQWLRNGKPVAGSRGTAKSYSILPADVGQRIGLRVHYGHLDVASDTKVSAASAKVAAGAIAVTKAPVVTGTKRAGSILTAVAGSDAPRPSAVRYQWLANGKAVKGATSSKLRMTAALAKAKISVRVTVSAGGYKARAVTSKAR